VYTRDKANANAPSARDTQYFEIFGNRAVYHDGWMASTTPPQPPWFMGTKEMPDVVNGYQWELYNINEDFSQANELAAQMLAKLKEMQELFLMEATKYQVLPLDNSVMLRVLTPKPSSIAGKTLFTYTREMAGLGILPRISRVLLKVQICNMTRFGIRRSA
jgi:arylsulfatase